MNIISFTGLEVPQFIANILAKALVHYWPHRKHKELTMMNLSNLDNPCMRSLISGTIQNMENRYEESYSYIDEDDLVNMLKSTAEGLAYLMLDGFREVEKDNLKLDSRGYVLGYKNLDRLTRMPECEKYFKQLEESRQRLNYNLIAGSNTSTAGTERTNPVLWESIVKNIKAKEIAGTRAGEWSARKAQMAVREYKEKGGNYKGSKSENNSLVKWAKQDWTTKSGKPSHETGERYLPREAIENLTSQEYAATSRAKKEGMTEGKQYVSQPEKIREKVKKYRT